MPATFRHLTSAVYRYIIGTKFSRILPVRWVPPLGPGCAP
jgi:hypothetical protein